MVGLISYITLYVSHSIMVGERPNHFLTCSLLDFFASFLSNITLLNYPRHHKHLIQLVIKTSASPLSCLQVPKHKLSLLHHIRLKVPKQPP